MTATLNPIPAADVAKASLDRLDAVATAMERKWGIDRLPKLIEAQLAVRFRSQTERLDAAIRLNVSAAISVQAEAMLRAWGTLDAAAIKGGWKPLAPMIWETVLPETGEIITIVRDADEAFVISKDGKGTIWTLAEVAIAIEAFGDTVRATKQVFPGAEVTAVRPAGTAARLAIGSAAPVAATERETNPVRKQPARNRRSRSAGFAGFFAPLPDLHPDIPSTKPVLAKAGIDWERGDDVPF
jgi:hypothetical protein